jgi:V/A-type H+-transporting ATPase subunit D
MTAFRSMPPGRAGRVWLQRRLALAQASASLLERKLKVLRSEESHYRLLAQRSGEEWDKQCRTAESALLRAALIGGRRGLRAGVDGPVEVSVTWAVKMGTRHPQEATCRWPDPGSDAAGVPDVAVIGARDRLRTAVAAAVDHAVAQEAFDAISREVALTSHRLRAVEDRWIPRLVEALRALDLALDENERAEGARMRWARAKLDEGGRGA